MLTLETGQGEKQQIKSVEVPGSCTSGKRSAAGREGGRAGAYRAPMRPDGPVPSQDSREARQLLTRTPGRTFPGEGQRRGCGDVVTWVRAGEGPGGDHGVGTVGWSAGAGELSAKVSSEHSGFTTRTQLPCAARRQPGQCRLRGTMDEAGGRQPRPAPGPAFGTRWV